MNAQEKKYVAMLELALRDLLQNKPWDDIQRATGLSTDRCYELEDLGYNLWKMYFMEQ